MRRRCTRAVVGDPMISTARRNGHGRHGPPALPARLNTNLVRWGQTELPPEAGIAVYVRGQSGKLAVARIYDDSEPPLTHLAYRGATTPARGPRSALGDSSS